MCTDAKVGVVDLQLRPAIAIHEFDSALRRHDLDAIRTSLENAAAKLFACPHGYLGLLAVGDVEVRNDRSALTVAVERRGDHEKPSLLERAVAGVLHGELPRRASEHGFDARKRLRGLAIFGKGASADIEITGAHR